MSLSRSCRCTVLQKLQQALSPYLHYDRAIVSEMLAIAVPLIFSNILQQFYNTVDAFVLGHYADQENFAAIGIASAVMNLFLFAIIGSCTGISVLFSQLYGREDFRRFRNEHFQAFVLGLGGTVVLSAAAIAVLAPLLHAVQVPDSLFPYVYRYLFLIFLGMPASFLYNLYSAVLRSVDRTRAILLILSVSVAVNLVLDVWFIRDLHLGVTGAAIATVVSQCLSALLSFLYIRTMSPALLFRKKDCHFDKALLQKTSHFAFVTGFHQSGLYIGKLLVQAVVNGAGTPIIAAYTATTRIEGFANSFGDSGAAATSVVTAHQYGARNRDKVEASYRASFLLLTVLGLVCSVIMYFTAGQTIGLLVDPGYTDAFANAVDYLKIVSVYYVFCFTGNTFAGYFDGIGRVNIPVCGALSHITMRLILSWLFIADAGLAAVAHATGIGWIWVNLFWGWIKQKYNKKDMVLPQ